MLMLMLMPMPNSAVGVGLGNLTSRGGWGTILGRAFKGTGDSGAENPPALISRFALGAGVFNVRP